MYGYTTNNIYYTNSNYYTTSWTTSTSSVTWTNRITPQATYPWITDLVRKKTPNLDKEEITDDMIMTLLKGDD